jgi:hypothetical protein
MNGIFILDKALGKTVKLIGSSYENTEFETFTLDNFVGTICG